MRRMRLATAFIFFILAGIASAIDTSGMRLYGITNHFTVYAEDQRFYGELMQSLENHYARLTRKYNLSFDERIGLYIYKDQMSFVKKVFGWKTLQMNVAGLADHVNRRIFITTIYDPCKTPEHMVKMPLHELTHILLPCDRIWIREGMAHYEGGMLQNFNGEKLPERIDALPFYRSDQETSNAYNLAGWMMKFIIEEQLNLDAERYFEFIRTPDDFNTIGVADEEEFMQSWQAYMKRQRAERDKSLQPLP